MSKVSHNTVKSSALVKYMPSSLDRIIVARALEIFVWEKPKAEFPNWRMVGNGSSCSRHRENLNG